MDSKKDASMNDSVRADLKAVAEDLHDRVIPAATAAGLRLDLARSLLAGGAGAAEVDGHLAHAAAAMKTLSTELRATMDGLADR